MTQPTVAILGASRDPEKYGNKSVRAHLATGYQVFPINPKADEIEGLEVYRSLADLPVDSVDRVSVYLPPHIGITMLSDIQAVNPGELWLNPGSENEELIQAAEAMGLNVIVACSIVDVHSNPAG